MKDIRKAVPANTAEGRVKVLVVEGDRVLEERPWQKNLILDQGLDMVASNLWADCVRYCAAGTDNTPVMRDSGTVTATQSGNTITASAPFFSSADINRTVNFDSGQSVKITGFSDAQTVTVNVSQTVGSSQFTVWYTNQVGLVNEQKRNNAYLTGSSNCGSTLVGNVLTHRRTFDFTAETGPVVYTELGWSNSSSSGNNLFSRVLLSSSVTVLSGQQLRVVYDLSITISPSTTQTAVASISGWPVSPSTTTAGSYGTQFVGMSAVDSNGNTGQWDSGAQCNEPATTQTIFLSSNTELVQAFGSSTNRSSNYVHRNTTFGPYVNGTFYRDRYVVFPVGEANRTDWRSMGISSGSSNNIGFVFVFDENQTKVNTNTLTLTFRSTWGRTLVNP